MSGEYEHIEARAVRVGDLIWNPYGGSQGLAEVTSEPRERPDGTIEFDCADGRTGRFFPHSQLRLRRAAMESRDAKREAERLAGDEARPDEETEQVAEVNEWGGRGPSASYAEWLAEGWDAEAGQ